MNAYVQALRTAVVGFVLIATIGGVRGYQCTECHVRGDGSFGTTLARAACFVGSGLTHSNCPPTNPGRFTRSAINFGTSFVNNPVTNSGGTGSPTSTTSGSS